MRAVRLRRPPPPLRALLATPAMDRRAVAPALAAAACLAPCLVWTGAPTCRLCATSTVALGQCLGLRHSGTCQQLAPAAPGPGPEPEPERVPVSHISELQPAPDPDKETATDSETEAEHLVRGGVAEKTRRLQQASKMSRIASAHTKSSRSRQKPPSGMGRTSTPLGNSLIGVSVAVSPRQQKRREMEELRRQQHEREEHANQAKIAARARREER